MSLIRKKIGIIGGGAAGFFAAILVKESAPDAQVYILEKSSKLLSKVRVSGGGRCNVTHACFDNGLLVKNYPRGGKELRSAFGQFNCESTIQWFKARGVELKAEADGRMFPVTDSSQTIVDCLMVAAEDAGVKIRLNCIVADLLSLEDGRIKLIYTEAPEEIFDVIIVAAGGSPTLRGFEWLKHTGHTIVEPVPSLFTFNVPDKKLHALMGVSVSNAEVKILETTYSSNGPLLITHWGFSGPAVLKLSSFAARKLADMNYQFKIRISWIEMTEEELREEFFLLKKSSPAKLIGNVVPPGITRRLWEYLLNRAGVQQDKPCGQLPDAAMNKLIQVVRYDTYDVKGKTTFKEEFVTCGGISLKEVDFKTMQSKKVNNLYFAGEVLDIDAVTGGFNFQAAWTTASIAAATAINFR